MTHPPDVEIMRKTCPPFWGVKDTPDMERRHTLARLVAVLIILAFITFVLWLGTRGAGADQNRPIPAAPPSLARLKATAIMQKVHAEMEPGPSAVAILSKRPDITAKKARVRGKDILEIGVGNCQDYALGMVSLCKTEGIPAVVVDMAAGDGLAHTVVEVEEKPGLWRIYDPLLNLRYDASGQGMLLEPNLAKLPKSFKPDKIFKERGYASYCGPGFWMKVKWAQARGEGRVWWEFARGTK